MRASIRLYWNADDPDDLDDDSNDSADSEPDDAPEAANTASSFRDDLREQDHALARLLLHLTSLEDEAHGRQGMFEAWKCVVYAPNEADFETWGKKINDTYPLQHHILSYISKEYMAWRFISGPRLERRREKTVYEA